MSRWKGRWMEGREEEKTERDRREKRKDEWRQRLTKRPFTLHSFASYPTSFSWALSLVVWKLWLFIHFFFKEWAQFTESRAYRSHQLHSRMDPRNAAHSLHSFSPLAEPPSLRWEIARKLWVMARLDSEALEPGQAGQPPRRYSNSNASSSRQHSVSCASTHQNGNHQRESLPWELEQRETPPQDHLCPRIKYIFPPSPYE